MGFVEQSRHSFVEVLQLGIRQAQVNNNHMLTNIEVGGYPLSDSYSISICLAECCYIFVAARKYHIRFDTRYAFAQPYSIKPIYLPKTYCVTCNALGSNECNDCPHIFFFKFYAEKKCPLETVRLCTVNCTKLTRSITQFFLISYYHFLTRPDDSMVMYCASEISLFPTFLYYRCLE